MNEPALPVALEQHGNTDPQLVRTGVLTLEEVATPCGDERTVSPRRHLHVSEGHAQLAGMLSVTLDGRPLLVAHPRLERRDLGDTSF